MGHFLNIRLLHPPCPLRSLCAPGSEERLVRRRLDGLGCARRRPGDRRRATSPPSAPQAAIYVVVCALGNTVANPSLVTWTGASPPTRGTTNVASAGCTPP